MVSEFENQVAQTLEEIKAQGLFKTERIITSPQDAHIAITGGKCVLNMCANNYLGLADHPALIAAAKEALETHGFGMASVRFICGTQDIHRNSKQRLPNSWALKIRFFTHPVSMQTAACSRHCSPTRTP